MLDRLALDVAERPDDAHSLYMYARQLGHAEEYDLAIACLERYLATGPTGLHAEAARIAAICCDRRGDRRGMYRWMHQATAYEPHRRLLWIELAHMYHADGDLGMALALARLAADLPLPPQQRETQPVEQLHHICQLIDLCQARLHAH